MQLIWHEGFLLFYYTKFKDTYIATDKDKNNTVENEYANKFKNKDGVRRMKQNIFIKLFI